MPNANGNLILPSNAENKTCDKIKKEHGTLF
jgi:hypothetical protein